MRKILLLFMFIALSAFSISYATDSTTGELVTVEFTTVLDADNQPHTTLEIEHGKSLTTTAIDDDDYAFVFHVVNGVIRDDLPEITSLVVSSNLHIQSVYHKAGEHAVLFVDAGGQFIAIEYVADGADAQPPVDLPDKPNYVVSSSSPWSDSYVAVDSSRVLVLQYELDTTATFTISVTGGTSSHELPLYNQIVTVTSDIEDFTHWEEDGVIVSYDETYRFSALRDRNLVAASGGVREPLVILSYDLAIRDGYKSFLGQYALPNGYTFVEAGYLMGEFGTTLTYGEPNVEAVLSNAIHPTTQEFLRSFPSDQVDSLRAYVIAKDEQDELVIYYSEYVQQEWADLGSIGGTNVDTIWRGKATRDEEKFTFIFSTDVLISTPPHITFEIYMHTGDLTTNIPNSTMYAFSVNTDNARRVHNYPNAIKTSFGNNAVVAAHGFTDVNTFYQENGVSHARIVITYATLASIGAPGITIDSIIPFSFGVTKAGSGTDFWYRPDLPGITGDNGEVFRNNPLDSVLLDKHNRLSTIDVEAFFSKESIEERFELTQGYQTGKALFDNLAVATVNNGVFAILEAGGLLWSDRTPDNPGATHRFNDNLPSGLRGKQFTYIDLDPNPTGAEITIIESGYVILVSQQTANNHSNIIAAGFTQLGYALEPIGPGDRVSFYAKWVEEGETISLAKWSFFVVEPFID